MGKAYAIRLLQTGWYWNGVSRDLTPVPKFKLSTSKFELKEVRAWELQANKVAAEVAPVNPFTRYSVEVPEEQTDTNIKGVTDSSIFATLDTNYGDRWELVEFDLIESS